MSDGIQIIKIDGVTKNMKFAAPEGWEFDKTSARAWVHLCEYTRELQKPPKLKRDIQGFEQRAYAMARLLANEHGMSATYWEHQARDLYNRKVEQ